MRDLSQFKIMNDEGSRMSNINDMSEYDQDGNPKLV